jgi:ferritin
MKINDELYEALLNQWVEEKENSHVYLYIGAYLKNKGIDRIGQHFIDSSKEEDAHAQSILDLMTDLNLPFEPRAIADMKFPCQTIMDIAEKFVQREIQTTQSLEEIRDIASNDSSFGFGSIIEEHIRKMISQQQVEMEESLSFKDKSELFKDWSMVALWDLNFK